MKGWRLLGLGLIFTLAVIAGTAVAQEDGEPQLTDPDDDGRLRAVSYISTGGLGCDACDDAAGRQAPPGLELTQVRFTETPRDLIVQLQVKGLSEELEDVAYAWEPTDTRETGPGHHGALYLVCWRPIEGTCQEAVYLEGWRVNGELTFRSGLRFWGPGCHDVIPCQYTVPYTIETGTPGTIEWQVPRALLPEASQGDQVKHPYAYIVRLEDKMPAFRIEQGGIVTDGYWVNYGFFEGVRQDSGYVVDEAKDGDPFTFQTPLEPTLPASVSSNRYRDPAGDFPGPERPDIDLREVAFDADTQHVHVSVKLGAVLEDPRDQTLYVNFGFSQEIPFIQVATWVDDGQRQVLAQRWFDFPDGNRTELDVETTVVPGQPGWLNFSIPRTGAPVVGEQFAWMWTGAYDHTPREELSALDPIQAMTETQISSFQWDLAGPGTAYNVTLEADEARGHAVQDAGAVDPSIAEIEDEAGDAQLPQDGSLLSGAPNQNDEDGYEITKIRAKAESPSLLRLTLEIADLTRVTVPPTYDEVLYAAAIETDQGRFMAVARYEPRPGDPGETDAEWFCTSDTSVLTESPELPPPGIPIDGFLRPSLDGEGGGTNGTSGASATIRFDLPRECLGDAPPGPLEVTRIGGGTYLIRDPGGQQTQIEVVDKAQDEVNRTIEPEALTQASTGAAPGGLGQPFGLENFWDILGIGGTILASAIGAVLVRRRRNALKAYLEEIEEIGEEHRDDPSGREAALGELLTRAKGDLVDGKLTENQYVVVKDRVEEELSEARAKGVEEAFGELPHRLLGKLKTMVSDGTLSTEDRRLFSTLLEDSDLTDEAKARIRRKLAIWAGETPEDA